MFARKALMHASTALVASKETVIARAIRPTCCQGYLDPDQHCTGVWLVNKTRHEIAHVSTASRSMSQLMASYLCLYG